MPCIPIIRSMPIKNHRPVMNGGIVIKFNANQRYTTDGVSAALFRQACKKAGVPTQTFCNRADLAGGSTLGNISSSQVSIPHRGCGTAAAGHAFLL